MIIASAFLILALQAASGGDSPSACSQGANCSVSQSGGLSVGTLMLGKPQFQLTEDLIRQVVAACPKGVPVTVMATGTQRAFPMQAALVNALRAAGFTVNEDSAAMLLPQPEAPLSVQKTPARTTVIIAPNA